MTSLNLVAFSGEIRFLLWSYYALFLYIRRIMKTTRKKKLKVVNFGTPSLTEIPKPDADAFYKSLLEIILDLHNEKEKNKEI